MMKLNMRWRMMLWGGVGVGLGLALVLTGALWLKSQHPFAGLVKDEPAPDFTLINEAQQPFALSTLRGEWILLTYGYTACPDVCPATLSILKRVKAQLGTANVRVVFVTIDPARDSAEVLAPYVHQYGPAFTGLTGAPEAIAEAAQQYNVKYEKQNSAAVADYAMAHTAHVFLIDPHFRWRVTYPFGVTASEMVADLRYLMEQEQP